MKPIVVFNPNAFPGKFEIEMECVAPKENMVLLDENDVQIPLQYIQSKASCKGRSRMIFVANLPSFGYRTFRLAIRENEKYFEDVTATNNMAENRWFKLVFDEKTGYITSLLKKNDGTEYLINQQQFQS